MLATSSTWRIELLCYLKPAVDPLCFMTCITYGPVNTGCYHIEKQLLSTQYLKNTLKTNAVTDAKYIIQPFVSSTLMDACSLFQKPVL